MYCKFFVYIVLESMSVANVYIQLHIVPTLLLDINIFNRVLQEIAFNL